jgi:hypothetical protein
MPTFIPAQPRLSAIVRADASGELTISGTSRALIAADVMRIRAGIIARCAAIGRQVCRPVRLSVVDVDGAYQLGIHPDAFVQILNADGTVDDTPDGAPRVIGDSPCRHCGKLQSLRNNYCTLCGTKAPHDVEAAPASLNSGPRAARGY